MSDKDAQTTQLRRQVRRRIVLVTPLLVLAMTNLTLLLGQCYCASAADFIDFEATQKRFRG